MNYVFDVDGTLTPSRGKIDKEFAEFFLRFCKRNLVYIVTGSDYAKTEEQLGYPICYAVEGVYNCSGNMLTKRGVLIYSKEFKLTEGLRATLLHEQMKSGFTVRTGNHIERRPGTVNFSIVGRNANKWERQQYIEWDNAMNERVEICKRLNKLFPNLDFVVGGETGIDIFEKGCDKGQVADHVKPFVFFGDRCEIGGNDYSIFIKADNAYQVKDWEETYRLLKSMSTT